MGILSSVFSVSFEIIFRQIDTMYAANRCRQDELMNKYKAKCIILNKQQQKWSGYLDIKLHAVFVW